MQTAKKQKGLTSRFRPAVGIPGRPSQHIIERHGNYLRVPHVRKDGSVLNAVEDFEIVDVDYQFQDNPAVPRHLREYVRRLWLMRNKLAHRTCLDSAMLTPEVLDFDVDTVA
jgi:hypothetical protein